MLTFYGKKPSSLDLLHTVFPSQISSTAVKFLLDIQHNSSGKLFLIYFPLCLSKRLYIDENDITHLPTYKERFRTNVKYHQKYVVLSCCQIKNPISILRILNFNKVYNFKIVSEEESTEQINKKDFF